MWLRTLRPGARRACRQPGTHPAVLVDWPKHSGPATNRLGFPPTASPRQLPEPLRDEIPSIEDLQGVVEKLRGDLKKTKDEPGTSLSDSEDG